MESKETYFSRPEWAAGVFRGAHQLDVNVNCELRDLGDVGALELGIFSGLSVEFEASKTRKPRRW